MKLMVLKILEIMILKNTLVVQRYLDRIILLIRKSGIILEVEDCQVLIRTLRGQIVFAAIQGPSGPDIHVGGSS